MAHGKIKQRKDGRYCIRVYIGRKDGKQQYKSVYGSTQKEAEAKADKIRASLRKGLDVMAENDTFKAWADRWLLIKETEVSPKWYRNYEGYINRMGCFYEAPITKIKTAHIQEFIIQLAKNNPKTHKPTARRTLKGYLETIQQILQFAIDNRVMDYNPARVVKLPSAAPASHRRALTEEEQSWIINTPHRAQRAAMIMMFAGLRRGELIPLTRSDIDLKSCTIRINKAVEMDGNTPVLKNTAKTEAGNRVVNIPQMLSAFLADEFSKDEKAGNINFLVCPAENGKMMTDTAWRCMWESYLIDLNFKYGNKMDKKGNLAKSKYNPNGVILTIPPITAHWLRHTFATMLYLSGVDVLTAKEQLGHADIKTTLGIYTHLDKVYKKKNISKLDEYLQNQFKKA